MSQRVNWVLDADIRSFFDSVDHEWLLRMLAHRIADPRVLRLVRMWLEAGILESDEWHETDRGTPQGAGISPLLANIFLHYVLDLWVHQWRRRHARGRVSIVRYADDFVMGFESAADARRMLADLKERLAKFGLSLHEDKTRLIEFGRLPAMARQHAAHLVHLPSTAKPEDPAHGLGLVRGCDRALPLAQPRITHPWAPRGMTRVTSGKSRVRESRMPGSVRAKPNGRATRPLT